MIPNCCKHKSTSKQCIRSSDKKVFSLPRKFERHTCITRPVKGFTMSSSCAPYKDCKRPKFGEYNVYINRNPNDTIPIKYATLQDVKNTIQKLEKLYKQGKYSHQRIWQVGMIMYVRLKPLKTKKPSQYKLAYAYHKFLGERTKLNKNQRKKIIFNQRAKLY